MRRTPARTVALASVLLTAVVLAACGGSHKPLFAIAGANPDNGPAAMIKYGCISCHTVPGVRGANGHVGPPLTDWAQRGYIAGLLPNEPDNLIRWIQYPQSVEPGVDMPNLGVTDSDARDIAAYLYSLK